MVNWSKTYVRFMWRGDFYPAHFWKSIWHKGRRKRRRERERKREREKQDEAARKSKGSAWRVRGGWIGVNEVAACRKLGRTTPYILSPVHAADSPGRPLPSRQINSAARIGGPTYMSDNNVDPWLLTSSFLWSADTLAPRLLQGKKKWILAALSCAKIKMSNMSRTAFTNPLHIFAKRRKEKERGTIFNLSFCLSFNPFKTMLRP